MSQPLLAVEGLRTHFHTDEGTVRAVDGIDFEVHRGETVCIVGESGSGKTVASETITQLIPSPPGEIAGGTITFDGEDITNLSEKRLRTIRGGRIGHVFQNPQGALNPVYTVGWQIVEAVQLHSDLSRDDARRKAIDLLDRVGIPEASARFDDYPHEFSGGMKQRIVIAMALASEPDLLIADEPTTALDVTIQAQILRLLQDLQEEFDMAILLITHDLGVVAEIADRVVVMYAGKVMEAGDVYRIFEDPAHPYTRALLDCLPGRGGDTRSIGGSLPDPTDPPDGCRFAARCPHAVEDCHVGDQPPMYDVGPGDHEVSCVHFAPGGDPSVVLGSDQSVETSAGRADGGRPESGPSEGGESR
ncbi:ABC transporter ATP-binding protein [Salinirubrum litoreum]|uniref:Nickel import system ATP-binding protein NikD n=1 Tax=Salinirubrum litoreum TaxID=1126234 RepID=A0ABD5RES1_9EURY|nr:ABC transporter ATP-binding protein [Salinirubrum litoreum]